MDYSRSKPVQVLVVLLVSFFVSSCSTSGDSAPSIQPSATPQMMIATQTSTQAPATDTPLATQTETPEPTLSPAVSPSPTGSAIGTDGMVLLYVPEGSFLMGSTSDDLSAVSDEFPQHVVDLEGFWIDQTEITNAMFARFLNEEGNQIEGNSRWLDAWNQFVRIKNVGGEWQAWRNYENHPVVEVTWYGAAAYCKWVGRRLPTEAEWEKAARGEDGRTYPWGEGIDCDHANYLNCGGYTVPVGSKLLGASPYGALDMAGNVWEWVTDWYDPGYYDYSPAENPTGPSTQAYIVVRGGSWTGGPCYVRAASRERGFPDDSSRNFGFRCVLSD